MGGGAAVAAVAFGLFSMPTLAQRGPTSLLPPGFGSSAPASEREEARPARPARSGEGAAASATPAKPALSASSAEGTGEGEAPAAPAGVVVAAPSPVADEPTAAELAAQQRAHDLPAGAHRSLDRIGPLTPETGACPPMPSGKVPAATSRR